MLQFSNWCSWPSPSSLISCLILLSFVSLQFVSLATKINISINRNLIKFFAEKPAEKPAESAAARIKFLFNFNARTKFVKPKLKSDELWTTRRTATSTLHHQPGDPHKNNRNYLKRSALAQQRHGLGDQKELKQATCWRKIQAEDGQMKSIRKRDNIGQVGTHARGGQSKRTTEKERERRGRWSKDSRHPDEM